MLHVTTVSKAFAGVQAVDRVSFSIPAGGFAALIGASGSGKTTTLRLINRLIEPDAGSITMDERAVTEGPAHHLRRQIGFMPQGGGLFPHYTIAQNIAVTPRLLGWSASRIAERVRALLDLVRLEPSAFAERTPAELSGGQRQRIAFARAIAAEPRLILLDEPFAALDPETREAVQHDFAAIHRDLGLTAVMVTHDMAEALTLAGQVIVLRDGRVVQDGPPTQLAREPADAYVRALVETPRRQARAIAAALGEGAPQ